MARQTFTLGQLKEQPLEKVLQGVADGESTVTCYFPMGRRS